jgi:hypothetical protein
VTVFRTKTLALATAGLALSALLTGCGGRGLRDHGSSGSNNPAPAAPAANDPAGTDNDLSQVDGMLGDVDSDLASADAPPADAD